jgi:hypothetical protein
MSTFWFTEQGGFTDVAPWAGRARLGRIADVEPRSRALVSGTIRSTKTIKLGSSPAFRAELVDDSGRLDLIFLGRRNIPGLVSGCQCTIEGTVLVKGRRLAVWNPLYRIEAAVPAPLAAAAPVLAPVVPMRRRPHAMQASGPEQVSTSAIE